MKYDIIGDIHGCAEELGELLYTLGMHKRSYDRTVVFCGDLIDRGPGNVKVLRAAMRLAAEGYSIGVIGNHDDKLRRWLSLYTKGQKPRVSVNHGLQVTLDELLSQPMEFLREVYDFLSNLPHILYLDEGKLVISHAGAPKYTQREPKNRKGLKAQRATCLYGVTTGRTLQNGFPERLDWAENYTGEAYVVHGHVVTKEPVVKNKVYSIDTGCVFGNKLTALRYPEMSFVQVRAKRAYSTKEGFSAQTE